MAVNGIPVTSPKLFKVLFEARWVWEYFSYFAFFERDVISSCRPGDGRPILVIPGFLCNDRATWPLRRFLTQLGYRTYGWEQGTNWGIRPGLRMRLLSRVSDLFEAHDRPLTLIGQSLGGVYARDLAATRPHQIAAVITLGTPQQGDPRATAVWKLFQWLNRHHLGYIANTTLEEFLRPLCVPSLSIYSKGDGIVPWQYCQGRRGHRGCEVEVQGSHIGLVHNPDAMRAISRYLATSTIEAAEEAIDCPNASYEEV